LKSKRTTKALGFILFILPFSPFSTAQASSCGLTGDLDTTDVTFDGSVAINCGIGTSNNNSNIDINTTQSGEFTFAGTNWGNEIKDDSPGNPGSGTGSFLGINWTLSATAGKSGSWTVSITDPDPSNLPVTVDLLAVLKGSSSWAGYLFTEELFSTEGDTAGSFEIAFSNNGNKIPNLSHMSLYLRDSSTASPVPVPASILLFSSGLIGLTRLNRKKKSL